MEIDEKNVNYLISRCRRLENIIEKFKLKIEDKDITIEVHEERIKELESTNHFDAAKLYQKELVKAEKRIKELEEFDQNLNKAGSYRFTKGLEDTIVHLKARIKELEERVGRIDELTNEVYDSRLDTEPTIGTVDFLEDSKNPNGLNSFKLNDKLYFATKRGFFKADYYVDPETEHTYEDVPLCISHEEYLYAASQSIKQEDPRDYPEECSE